MKFFLILLILLNTIAANFHSLAAAPDSNGTTVGPAPEKARKATVGKPSAQTLPTVNSKRIASISLNNVPMKEAAKLISLAASVPIVVSYDASKVMVDLHLRDVTASMALDAVCRASGLWYQKNEKDGIFHIMTINEFKNTLHFTREDRVEVVQILYPAAKDVGDALSKLFINRVIWVDPKKSSGDRYTDINRALKRMDLLAKRGTFDITTDTEQGTSDSNEDEDNDDTNDKKSDADKATRIDTAKIKDSVLKQFFTAQKEKLSTDLKFHELSNTPGVVFLSVLPENNSLMLRSADGAIIDQMIGIIEKLDKPSPQVLLEVKILSVLLDDTRDRAVDFLFSGDNGKISGGFADGLMSAGSRGQEILVPDANMVPQGSGIDQQAAIFNVVSNNFKARVQLLEKDERVTQLATPNLIVSDNESSTLFIGTETTVLEKAQSTTTYTEVSSGVFQPNISWDIEAPRRKIGTSLLLTPKIHADRTVTLRLLQEQSKLGSEVKNVYSGGTKSEGSEEQYFISQDIDLQRVVTTVVGKDRDFMVVGGLIHEEIGKKSEKTPFFSEIPVIGELAFTRMEATRVRKEILIIIRPFVMLAPGESQLISKSYLERMSQHPAARDDLPSLGVNSPDDLAKPVIVNPNDPWLIRMFDKIQRWGVDDSGSFDIYEQTMREQRRKNHREAVSEMNELMKKEDSAK